MDLLRPGQIFAKRYRIDRFLAQGGMGAVFVAEQLATELTVAVKVLFPHLFASQKILEQFQLEARVAARVQSENIVAVFDAGLDEETQLPFLVMEMLKGQSLQEIIEERGAFSPEQVTEYLVQCGIGLDRAHNYRDRNNKPSPIVHRDLKPENLFLTSRDDGKPLIKILDFGIAKVLSNTSNLSQEMKGTPLFMAYEQAAGLPITPQTDVWALGLVAFYLLTKEHYWRAPHDEDAGISAILGEILLQPIVRPAERLAEFGLRPSWGIAFDDWFLKCVNKDPSQRFPSAGEAVRALTEVLGTNSETTVPQKAAPTVSAVAAADTLAKVSPEQSDTTEIFGDALYDTRVSKKKKSTVSVWIYSAVAIVAAFVIAIFFFVLYPKTVGSKASVEKGATPIHVVQPAKKIESAKPIDTPKSFESVSAAPAEAATALDTTLEKPGPTQKIASSKTKPDKKRRLPSRRSTQSSRASTSRNPTSEPTPSAKPAAAGGQVGNKHTQTDVWNER